MLLKKVEFQGFKSFVDPTTMSFEPGISAIVGPNGCGKSNISDAIRWVLGEQSAKALRGSKMSDVIFNGTDMRKPSGMSEVSLTISNEDRKLPVDFAEVTVTRRAYRSGENEYLLNKVPSRLKDIHKLFSDTGVGTDGYSLLEQGKMDLILSSKPLDRRSVFEEAAGITNYKTQRDEALRKLEGTEQNLLRVGDIVAEVKRQISSLERQARKAEKYQVLKSELDRLHSRSLLRELKAARERLRAAEQDLEAVRESMSVLEISMREKEARIAELQLTLAKDEAALSQATEAVHQIETEAAQTDKQIELNRSQILFQAERHERTLADAAQLRQKEAVLRKELEAARAELEEESQALALLQHEISGQENLLKDQAQARRTASEQAQALQQKSLDLINRRSSTRAEIESFHGRGAQLSSRLGQLKVELAESEERLRLSGEEMASTQAKVGGKRVEAQTAESDLGGQTLRKKELEDSLRRLEEALADGQVTLSSDRARLSLLEELSKALEGFEAGPKALLQASQKGEGSLSSFKSLAHLVRTSPEFELAVEVGLGHRLQTLLFSNREDGLKALAWLRGQKQGRASFIVASELRGSESPFSEELLSAPGVVGSLASVLKSDGAQANVVQWLAGRLLLVKDFESGLALREKLPLGCAAVALDGALIAAEGAITNGSTETAQRGILSREREIEALKLKIESDGAKVKELLSKREEARGELGSLGQDIEKRSAELKDLQIEMAKLQKEESSRTEELERLGRESAERRKSIEQVEVESAGYKARVDSLERSLQEMASEESQLKGQLEARLAEAERLRGEEENIQNALSALRVKDAQASQKQEHLRSTASRLESESSESAMQAARREAESSQAKDEQAALARRNEGLEEKLKESFSLRDDAKEKVVAAAEVRHGHQEELSVVERALRELRSESSEKAEQKHHLEMAAQELRIKAGQSEEALTRDYHVQIEEGIQEESRLEAEGGEAFSQERLEELKAKVAELGVVNPAAAEEYRELEQRHSLLVGQVEDLRSAKMDLQKVIAKINEESRDRFLKTFERVHENFKRIFRTLFGGGEAKLILLEDADMLEAGIDIVARPPSKRPQSISLLSGGEKALTAIALLFALFESKPSPFCVLDEIDAPLDDANIGRFSNLLTEYAHKTQFIVITHSKLTMEKADIMYGVTMEEPGVSRVISARFKEESKARA